MKVAEISLTDLVDVGRWKVEIFTDDNSQDMSSKWPMVSISELADCSNLAMEPADYPTEQFFYVGLENVESISGDPIDLRKKRKHEIKSRCKVFKEDCILYGRLRPYLRKVFLPHGDCREGLCSTEFIVLKPLRDKIHPQVLRALLASEVMATQFARLQIGAALPRVSSHDFFRVKIPLPPMKVQQKMIQQLETLQNERLELKERLLALPTMFDGIVSKHAFG